MSRFLALVAALVCAPTYSRSSNSLFSVTMSLIIYLFIIFILFFCCCFFFYQRILLLIFNRRTTKQFTPSVSPISITKYYIGWSLGRFQGGSLFAKFIILYQIVFEITYTLLVILVTFVCYPLSTYYWVFIIIIFIEKFFTALTS